MNTLMTHSLTRWHHLMTWGWHDKPDGICCMSSRYANIVIITINYTQHRAVAHLLSRGNQILEYFIFNNMTRIKKKSQQTWIYIITEDGDYLRWIFRFKLNQSIGSVNKTWKIFYYISYEYAFPILTWNAMLELGWSLYPLNIFGSTELKWIYWNTVLELVQM